MKSAVNLLGYLMILAGCSFEAWLIYAILSVSYLTTASAVITKGYPARPKITITSPASDLVSQPMIQIIGQFPFQIETITCDVTNIATHQAGWHGEGYITGHVVDSSAADRNWKEFLKNSHKHSEPKSFQESARSVITTNIFQVYDVSLTKGMNLATIKVTDRQGKHYYAKKFYKLDYSNKTNPPVLKVVWPQDKCRVGSDSFGLQAEVDDFTATIHVSVKDAQGQIHSRTDTPGRDGMVWVEALPLSKGLNEVTIVATDVVGNSSTNHLGVTRSLISITMQPLTKEQSTRSSATIKGTVSEATCTVKINGITATVHPDGTWEAHGVPINRTDGMEAFKITAYENASTNHASN